VTHLRNMMLEELQRRNYTENTTRSYTRTVEDFARRFNCSPDRLGPRHIRQYQAELFQKQKLSPGSDRCPSGSLKVLLQPDTQKELEHRRNPVSEKGPWPSSDPRSGRSRSIDPGCRHFLPSHSADDALRYRRSELRVDAPKVQRRRQAADGRSLPGWQRAQRP
jgi:Phage integrase, N-terminal SAM-like domain